MTDKTKTAPPILGEGWLPVEQYAALMGLSIHTAREHLRASETNGLEVRYLAGRNYVRQESIMTMRARAPKRKHEAAAA